MKARGRIGMQKVRSGCLTCKKRRVKCDETQPTCIRCSKAGVACAGYLKALPKSCKPGPVTTRALLPRNDAPIGLVLKQPSSLLLNETDVEHRYTQHFHDQTSSDFSLNFDDSIWNRLIMQTARNEPFVRHAVVAIGAVNKSLQMSISSSKMIEPNGVARSTVEMSKLHRKFALLEYSKALKEVKNIIENSTLTPRQALLASLLSFCFENLLENRPVAMYHAHAGYSILQNWLLENSQSDKASTSYSSSRSTVVEDDLVSAFEQLNLQIVTIGDRRDADFHNTQKHVAHDVVSNMPASFNDINEARHYLRLLTARSYHFLLTAWEMSDTESFARPFETRIGQHTFITNACNTLHGTSKLITEELLKQQKIYADEILKWRQAFVPLWNRLSQEIPSNDLLRPALLLTNCMALGVMVAAVIFFDQVSYDGYNPIFQDMIDLIQAHIVPAFESSTKPHNGGFLLDFGISCPLSVVAMRCRDSQIRQTAIDILRSWFIEGPNDCSMIAKVGTYMMEVEEEGNDSGFIPESSRIIPSLYCLDPTSNTILMQFCQPSGGLDGGPVWKEKEFHW